MSEVSDPRSTGCCFGILVWELAPLVYPVDLKYISVDLEYISLFLLLLEGFPDLVDM